MRILILGGTGEARELAARLDALGHEAITSLAGRTRNVASLERFQEKYMHFSGSETRPDKELEPFHDSTKSGMALAGAVRSGGFGGAQGLAAYLEAQAIDCLIDGTHPFAERISAHAVTAAALTKTPLLRYCRPPWDIDPDWRLFPNLAAGAKSLSAGARVLLSIGHGGLDVFLARRDCQFLARLIEPPSQHLPDHCQALLARPPFHLEGEKALLRAHAITHLVAKNSGGAQTRAKLDAAREMGVRVIMIERPILPRAEEYTDIECLLARLQGVAR